jgi:hypothetical protein
MASEAAADRPHRCSFGVRLDIFKALCLQLLSLSFRLFSFLSSVHCALLFLPHLALHVLLWCSWLLTYIPPLFSAVETCSFYAGFLYPFLLYLNVWDNNFGGNYKSICFIFRSCFHMWRYVFLDKGKIQKFCASFRGDLVFDSLFYFLPNLCSSGLWVLICPLLLRGLLMLGYS